MVLGERAEQPRRRHTLSWLLYMDDDNEDVEITDSTETAEEGVDIPDDATIEE